MKTFYETTKYEEYESEAIDCCLKSSSTTIKLKIKDITDGWEIVEPPSQLEVNWNCFNLHGLWGIAGAYEQKERATVNRALVPTVYN